MKYRRLLFALSLQLILIMFAGCSGSSAPAPFNTAQLPAKQGNDPALPAGYTILDRQTGDVTGDGTARDIVLIGRKPNADSHFADDLSIIVQDGSSQNSITVKLPGIGGYGSHLFIGDFNGDKVDDVLITVPTGGSGGYTEHRIVAFAGGPDIIFDEKDNSGVAGTGHFIDGFRIELTEEATKRSVTADLNNKKDVYVNANLYDAKGNLRRQQTISINPPGELFPVDVDSDGIYELRCLQRVSGMYNADTVAYIYSIWKYQDQKWNAKQIEVSSVLLSYGEKNDE